VGRIISGTLGSLRLASPAKASRPTTDRVRESLFGLLEAKDLFSDAAVLDLFAGTGALAFESISRGAVRSVLVERDKAALRVIAENQETVTKALQLSNQHAEIRVIGQQVSVALKKLRTEGLMFDLIFVDPPYDFSDAALEAELSSIENLLTVDGLLLLERAKSGFRGEFSGLKPLWDRSYGDTRILAFGKND